MAKVYEYKPSAFGTGFTGTIIPNVDEADLTLSRTSQAYRTNKDGLLELMPSNTPRIDYSDDLNCPSLLLEPQATNLISNSNDFSQWIRSNPVVSASHLGVDGNNSATYIDLLNNSSFKRLVETDGVVNGGTYTFSVYIKKHEDDADGTFPFAYYNDSVGYVKVLKNITSEWQRHSITWTQDTNIVGYGFNDEGTGDAHTLTKAYICFAQLEEGEVSTSYTPTTGVPETRTADTNVQTGDISQYLNQTEGVFDMELKIPLSSDQYFFSLVTNNGKYIQVRNWSGGRYLIEVSDRSNAVTNIFNINDDYFVFKIAITQSEIKIKINNNEYTTSGFTLDAGDFFKELKLMRNINIQNVFGSIKSIKIYDSINDY